MKCVEIIETPEGPQPLNIREAWVGLQLPLDPMWHSKKHSLYDSKIYFVPASEGMEILQLHKPDAARWYRENTTVVRDMEIACFKFNHSACRVTECQSTNRPVLSLVRR